MVRIMCHPQPQRLGQISKSMALCKEEPLEAASVIATRGKGEREGYPKVLANGVVADVGFIQDRGGTGVSNWTTEREITAWNEGFLQTRD